MFTLLCGFLLTADPFPPTPIGDADAAALTAAADRAGLTLDPAAVAGGFTPGKRLPLWNWLDLAAGATGRRLVVSPDGRKLTLAAGTAPSDVVGPFRLAVRGVTCRHDYDAGPPVCELALDLHWEPRLAVVRVSDGSGKTAVSGARLPWTLRRPAPPRSQPTVHLEQVYTITAAEQLLRFAVPDLSAAKPQTRDGVTLTVKPLRRLDEVVELRLDLLYPEGHPEFESFESWTANNRCRLVHRDGRTLEPLNSDEDARGRGVSLGYRFRAAAVGDPAGWTLHYDTPGPLREFEVRFRLKDVPLP